MQISIRVAIWTTHYHNNMKDAIPFRLSIYIDSPHLTLENVRAITKQKGFVHNKNVPLLFDQQHNILNIVVHSEKRKNTINKILKKDIYISAKHLFSRQVKNMKLSV